MCSFYSQATRHFGRLNCVYSVLMKCKKRPMSVLKNRKNEISTVLMIKINIFVKTVYYGRLNGNYSISVVGIFFFREFVVRYQQRKLHSWSALQIFLTVYEFVKKFWPKFIRKKKIETDRFTIRVVNKKECSH